MKFSVKTYLAEGIHHYKTVYFMTL